MGPLRQGSIERNLPGHLLLVKRTSTSGLAFIFVTLLIDVLGIGLLIPILPKFVAQLSHQSASEAARHYGWLLSLYAAMQFLFSPLLGNLSDRFGRRPVLLLSLFFAGIDYILMAMAPSLAWLYVGRILSGITGASFTVANAYIADVSKPEQRAQNFGIIGAAFGVGFIIGPALGGYLGQWGPRVPFWAAAFLCFANLGYGWLILPESLRPENRRRLSIRDLWLQSNPLGALRVLGRYPIVWSLTGTLVATNLAMHFINSTWVLFVTERFKWSEQQTGVSLAAFGAVALVYQLGLARIVLPLWGERRTMLIGLVVAALEFAAYGLATQGWMIYVIMLIGGMGLLAGQATQGLLSRQVGEDEQGALQGALTGLVSLTGIVGPLVATELFAAFTREGAAPRVPGISFFVAAGLNVLGLAISLRVLGRAPSSKAASPGA